MLVIKSRAHGGGIFDVIAKAANSALAKKVITSAVNKAANSSLAKKVVNSGIAKKVIDSGFGKAVAKNITLPPSRYPNLKGVPKIGSPKIIGKLLTLLEWSYSFHVRIQI